MLMTAILLLAFVAGALFWRNALIGILALLCFEGIPRLWLGDPLVLLVKDAGLLGVYAGFAGALVMQRASGRLPRRLAVPLLAFAAIALLETLNPNLGSLWVGLVGARSTLFYVPLLFVVPAAFPDSERIRRLIEQILFLSVPVCLAGLVQFCRGPEAYVAMGGEFADSLFVTGGYLDVNEQIYRPNATFAWSGHYGAFLLFSSVLGLGMTLAPRRRHRIGLSLITALNLLAAMTSGQRMLFILLPLVLLLILRANPLRVRMTFAAAGLCCVAIAAALLVGGPFLVDRFLSVFEDPSYSVVESYGAAIRANFNLAISSSVLGAGLGKAAAGSRHLGEAVFIENHYAKTLYELGWPGLLVLIWLLGSILALGWMSARTIEDPWSRSIAGVICAVHAAMAVWGLTVCMLDYPVFSIPFWAAAGVLLRLLEPSFRRPREEKRPDLALLEPALGA